MWQIEQGTIGECHNKHQCKHNSLGYKAGMVRYNNKEAAHVQPNCAIISFDCDLFTIINKFIK